MKHNKLIYISLTSSGKIYATNQYQVSLNYTTVLRTRVFLPLWYVILMTTAYDRKLVQNIHNLLSSSVADMVVANPVPPLLRMKGSLHCHQNFHFLPDPQLVTDSNINTIN